MLKDIKSQANHGNFFFNTKGMMPFFFFKKKGGGERRDKSLIEYKHDTIYALLYYVPLLFF